MEPGAALAVSIPIQTAAVNAVLKNRGWLRDEIARTITLNEEHWWEVALCFLERSYLLVQ